MSKERERLKKCTLTAKHDPNINSVGTVKGYWTEVSLNTSASYHEITNSDTTIIETYIDKRYKKPFYLASSNDFEFTGCDCSGSFKSIEYGFEYLAFAPESRQETHSIGLRTKEDIQNQILSGSIQYVRTL